MNIAVIIRAAQGSKQPYKKKRKPTFFFLFEEHEEKGRKNLIGGPARVRTRDGAVMSRLL